MFHRKFPTSLMLALTLFSLQAHADWGLESDASTFHYFTSKAAAVTEANRFTELSGVISDSGEARLEITLASVDTAVDVRNQRMRDILFQIDRFPLATATVAIDINELELLPTGTFSTKTYPVTVELHGVSQEIMAALRVSKLSENTIEVQPVTPLIVNAASFDLADGVEELRTVAGLPSINPNVVVDFSLVFEESM